jgi:hypothetical protein
MEVQVTVTPSLLTASPPPVLPRHLNRPAEQGQDGHREGECDEGNFREAHRLLLEA